MTDGIINAAAADDDGEIITIRCRVIIYIYRIWRHYKHRDKHG